MEVIIVSKTKMSNAVCVGGVLTDGRFVRLLKNDGHNQDEDTDIKIGETYTIDFRERHSKVFPHVEDILVSRLEYRSSFDSISEMEDFIQNGLGVKVWRGSTEIIFDGKLSWTKAGSGYISRSGDMPENSVGFWVSDKDLKIKRFDDKIRYFYPPKKETKTDAFGEIETIHWRNIPYTGFQDPVEKIPAGTLIRLSLARWWSPNNETEERCYLQLSGWYTLKEKKDFNWMDLPPLEDYDEPYML